MNNVELKPSLLLYSIHSKNEELFYLLESSKISPPIQIYYNDENGEKNSNENSNYLPCLLESIKCHHNEIPSSATSIKNDTFRLCKSLTQITIPSSVTYIGSGAFFLCSSLKQVLFEKPSFIAWIMIEVFGECS